MRVLVIDDDPLMRQLFKTGLEARSFLVDVAADGTTGVAMALAHPYDAIVLDYYFIGSPHCGGPDIARAIRKEKRAIPIIVLSVENADKAKVEMLGLCEAFLKKPVSVDVLAAQLRAFARIAHVVESEVLKAADIQMEPAHFRLTRGGKEIHLRNREFELLQFLMRNNGKVLSAETILKSVWDANADPFTNTVATHINALRRKVDDPFKEKLIETIPGRGYRLRAG